jgi:hypothetical protein
MRVHLRALQVLHGCAGGIPYLVVRISCKPASLLCGLGGLCGMTPFFTSLFLEFLFSCANFLAGRTEPSELKDSVPRGGAATLGLKRW